MVLEKLSIDISQSTNQNEMFQLTENALVLYIYMLLSIDNISTDIQLTTFAFNIPNSPRQETTKCDSNEFITRGRDKQEQEHRGERVKLDTDFVLF